MNTHCWNNHKVECKDENYLLSDAFLSVAVVIPESPYEGLREG